MESATTIEFAHAARRIGAAARQLGLEGPGFRCPPKVVGADRTVRRRPNGAVVAVRVAGRPMAAVVADLIEGVIVTNRLTTPAADRARTELWRRYAGGDVRTAADASAAERPVAGAA